MTRAAHAAIVLIAASAAALAAAATTLAQRPASPPAREATPQFPRGSASIAGVVVLDAAEASPIRRVTVMLAGAELKSSRLAVTDDAGRFTFADLPAGRFTLTATRSGYVPAAYGSTRGWHSPGVPIAVADGEAIADLAVKMLRGAVITGRVTDAHGRPLPDATVSIGELRSFAGALRFVPAPGPREWTVDDRGVFRAYGLPPGTFVVAAHWREFARRTIEPTPPALADWVRQQSSSSASGAPGSPVPMPPPATGLGFAPIFFPGTADASAATAITLAAGEERGGIDITLSPVPHVTISGRITMPGGAPAAGVEIFAFPSGGGPEVVRRGIPPIGSSDKNGDFAIGDVAPGRFTLLAQSGSSRARVAPGGAERPQSASVWARAEVVVDGRDLTGVMLRLEPGATISGRVVFENLQPPFSAELQRTTVRMAPPPDAPGAFITLPPAPIAADGTFTIAGAGPGSYLLSVTPPGPRTAPSWMPVSIVAGGRDLLTSPLEVAPAATIGDVVITLTERVTSLSGRLQDAAGRPAPEHFVLAFPVDRRLWTMGRDRLRPPARPASDGRYELTALLPGEYYVVALTEIQPNDHLDPLFLEQLVPAAIRVTIAVGDRKTLDLQLQKESGSVLRKP